MPRLGACAALVVACAFASACTAGTSTSAADPDTRPSGAGEEGSARSTIESQSPLTMEGEDLVGRFYVPEGGSGRRAVMVIGGSEGGTPNAAAREFARAGYPTLALAYFEELGLPQDLHRIPLEYFARALRWLRDQPETSGRPPAIVGTSRGGEAVLLIGATYPDLVGGIVANVPAHVAVCGYPDPKQPSWTLHGRPLPCYPHITFPVGYFGAGPRSVVPDRLREAEVPVEQIDDPLLLICGGEDRVWPSCPMSQQVMERMDQVADAPDHTLRAYPDAGHWVAIPPALKMPGRAEGAAEAKTEARASAWRATLGFLDRLPT